MDIVASVIILNLNGIDYLKNSLYGLSKQTYPSEKFEIIIVDNGSQDGSIEFLEQQYPDVFLIKNRENLGFASGNNLAFQKARGKYFVLLNNDTFPLENWLSAIISTAENMEDVGIVAGKSLLYYDQLTLTLNSTSFKPENDARNLGIMIFDVQSSAWKGNIQYLSGFYGKELSAEGKFRWTDGNAKIGVPIDKNQSPASVQIEMIPKKNLHYSGRKFSEVPVQVWVEDLKIFEEVLTMDERRKISLVIPDTITDKAEPVIQNAGSLVNKNGFGRDRGALVKMGTSSYEIDQGQYDELEIVFAACGANMLIKRELFEQIGGFEDKYFAYYEDTEYSWRTWLNGWKIIYEPKAVIRHIHCGTSKEWSPLFIFLTERNRLAMLTKYGGLFLVIKNNLHYLFTVLKTIVFIIAQKYIKKKNIDADIQLTKLRLKVILSLLSWSPSIFIFRIKNIAKFLRVKNTINSLISDFE